MNSTAQTVLYAILLPLHALHIIYSFHYMYTHRHRYPYNARPIVLTTIMIVGVTFSGMTTALYRIDSNVFPCWTYFIGVFSLIFIGIPGDVFRMIFIYFQFIHTEHLIQLCDESVIQESELPRRLIDERRRYSDKNLGKYYVILILLGELIMFVLLLSIPDIILPNEDGECMISGIHPLSIQLISIVTGTPFVVFSEKNLEKVKESSFLKEEFDRLRPIRIFGLTTIIMTLSIPPLFQFSTQRFWYLDIVQFFVASVAIYSVTMEPMRLYRKKIVNSWQSRKSKASSGRVMQLEIFLKDRHNYIDFQEFLVEEFCAENLLFWKSVNQLQNIPLSQKEEARHSAEKIAELYIYADAPFCINISAGARDEALLELARVGELEDIRTAFDSARLEVLELMAGDSFYRFQKMYPNKSQQEILII